MEVALIIVLLIIVAVWLRLNHGLYHDLFSPFNLLLAAWVIPLSLRAFSLSGLEQPWKTSALVVLAWVTLALIVPSLIFSRLIQRQGNFKRNAPRFARVIALARSRSFQVLLLTFWLISFSAYLYAEFITNPVGIPLVAAVVNHVSLDPAIHRWGKDNRWVILTGLLYVLTPMAYLAFRASRRWVLKAIFLGMALAWPTMALLKLSRSDIFIAALNIAVIENYLQHYTRTRKRLPTFRYVQYALILVAGLGILYGTLYVRIGSRDAGPRYADFIEFKLKGDSPLNEVLAQVYGYMALPFENFYRNFITLGDEFHVGSSVFRPILSILGQGSLGDQIESRIHFARAVSGAAGSATFLTAIYGELRLEGLILVPLVYGLLVNFLYARFRTRPSLTNLLLYLGFVYPWSWLYFNNAFAILTFYLNALFIVGFIFLLRLLRASPSPRPAATAPTYSPLGLHPAPNQ